MASTDPDRGAVVANMAISLHTRFKQTGNQRDLEAAIAEAKTAVTATPVTHPYAAAARSTLANLLRTQAERTGDAGALNAAITCAEEALQLDAEHVPAQTNAAALYQLRFTRTGQRDDIDRCIQLALKATARTPKTSAYRATVASVLSTGLICRYERYGNDRDLEAAILVARESITLPSTKKEALAAVAVNLAGALRIRSEMTSSAEELDEAIEAGHLAVSLAEVNGPTRVAALANLAASFALRAAGSLSLDDLNRAIDLWRHALEAQPTPDRLPDMYSGLALALRARFERTDHLPDLEAAVASCELSLTFPGSEARHLSDLSAVLRTRFERLGRLGDIERAIDLARMALGSTPRDHLRFPVHVTVLALALLRLFVAAGDLKHIDEAISIVRDAVAVTPSDNRRLRLFANIASLLRARYERSGDLADLNESVAAARRASQEASDDDPRLPLYLATLAASLMRRFESHPTRADIDQAVTAYRQALDRAPEGSPARVMYLSGLGFAMLRRYEEFGDNTDLDLAVDNAYAAAEATPAEHPIRAGLLSNLVAPLLARFNRDRRADDLNAAVEKARQAVAAPGAQGGLWHNLGVALQAAYEATWNENIRVEAMAAFARCASSTATLPLVRASAATHRARLAGSVKDWRSAGAAFAEALELLTAISDRRSTWDSRQRQLGRLPGLARDAAAVSLRRDDPEGAVTILEQARGVLIGQMLELRTDSDALRPCHASLADEFDRLRAILNTDTMPSLEDDADLITLTDPSRWRREAAEAFDALLATIRGIPEHSDFLRPPSPAALTRCAARGPVAIINVSRYGCDALLLQSDGVRPKALPDLVAADVADRASALIRACADPDWATNKLLNDTLQWLADSVVDPVLDELFGSQASDGPPPRVWWLPTGPLSALPLHAAGSALQRVVSSYTPTLRALMHAQPITSHVVRSLVVGVTEADGYPELPGAADEAALISAILPGVGKPLINKGASRAAVLAGLVDSQWAHFACHAVTDGTDPAANALILADQELFVRDLLAAPNKARYLAYLSACATVLNQGRLADEAIHVASAVLLAGFQHVLGALWRVSDAIARELAADIYPDLIRNKEPARALHSVVSALQTRYPRNPLLWAGFIHIGP